MIKTKIIHGQKDSFELEFNTALKLGWLAWIETYRVFEYAGHIIYSIVVEKEEGEKKE